MLSDTKISMAFHRAPTAFPSLCKPRSSHRARTCDSQTFAFSFINHFPANVLEAWSVWAGERITRSCPSLLPKQLLHFLSLLQNSNFLFGALLQSHLHCKSTVNPKKHHLNQQIGYEIVHVLVDRHLNQGRSQLLASNTGAVTWKKWKIIIISPWSNVSAMSHRYVYRS